MVQNAMALIGVVETPSGSNRSPMIDQMMNAVGSPLGESWCAAFVSWVNKLAGAWVPGSDAGACGTWLEQAKAKGTFKTTSPIAGDVVLYNFDGGTDAHHCGIVCRVPGDNRLYTTEGNTTTAPNTRTGDGVYYKRRQLGQPGILGYVPPIQTRAES